MKLRVEGLLIVLPVWRTEILENCYKKKSVFESFGFSFLFFVV